MTISTTIPSSNSLTYWQSIWNIPANRKFLLWGLGLSVSSFILFKLLYPYPDFFGDSYSYIFAASAHLDINIWPIGYSKFLAGFHALTHSDIALIAFQYFFIQLVALHFFFTILYFFNTSQWTRNVLFTFLFINPLTLYLSNTINSDALFGALSLLWMTELIWIIQRPRVYQIITQATLLFLCFTIRNNAYYYPIVAAVAFILSNQVIQRKLIGIVLPFGLLLPFIIYTKNAAYKLTGSKQFSLFTGWQLANNALYIYDRAEIDSTTFLTSETRELNRIAIHFFKHVNPEIYHEMLDSYVGNFFIRQPEAPLKQYFGQHYKAKGEFGSIVNWAKASEVYEPFGESIILSHPIAYIQYFVYPNAWHYLIPPLSHLEKYNYGGDEIDPIAQHWFDYAHPRIHAFSYQFQGILLIMYPAFFLLINLYYIWNLILFSIRKSSILLTTTQVKIQKLVLLFFLTNLGFSLVATANILRYQFVPLITLLSFSLLYTDVIEMQVRNKKEKQKKLDTETNQIRPRAIQPFIRKMNYKKD